MILLIGIIAFNVIKSIIKEMPCFYSYTKKVDSKNEMCKLNKTNIGRTMFFRLS